MLYLYEINRLMVDNDVRKLFNNVDEKQITPISVLLGADSLNLILLVLIDE